MDSPSIVDRGISSAAPPEPPRGGEPGADTTDTRRFARRACGGSRERGIRCEPRLETGYAPLRTRPRNDSEPTVGSEGAPKRPRSASASRVASHSLIDVYPKRSAARLASK